MKLRFVLGVFAFLLLVGVPARADHLYQVDDGTSQERFNNSETTEVEDNWVANSFEVVGKGTRLLSVTFFLGENFNKVPVAASIYLGSSLTDPSDIVRIYTVDALVTGERNTWATITFDKPIDLMEGDIFYAALLIPEVPGNVFPFHNNRVNPQGQSFFDVGFKQSAPYDLDATGNATVLGGQHPVVNFAQSAGNLLLRVNATAE